MSMQERISPIINVFNDSALIVHQIQIVHEFSSPLSHCHPLQLAILHVRTLQGNTYFSNVILASALSEHVILWAFFYRPKTTSGAQ